MYMYMYVYVEYIIQHMYMYMHVGVCWYSPPFTMVWTVFDLAWKSNFQGLAQTTTMVSIALLFAQAHPFCDSSLSGQHVDTH